MATKAKLTIEIWTRDGELPDDLPEAFEPHLEHIRNLAFQGFLAGQVVDDRFEGWFVARPGKKAFTAYLQKARSYRTREEAMANKCSDETVLSLDEAMDQ